MTGEEEVRKLVFKYNESIGNKRKIISDDEINSNISTLEQKLQANNLEILDKKNSLNKLQTKIDPLSGQITDLKTQKTDLLAKYNEEILKQSSTILNGNL